MSTLLSRGHQLLDYEHRIQELQAAKKSSISELNAELRQLETDRTTLREELNAKIASYKPPKENSSRESSLSSILSLKFVKSSPKLDLDPMSVINSKRQKIEKMDAKISQNLDLKKKEEARQLQIHKINKEIRRIVDSISEIDRTEAEKSKAEIWCLHTISRLTNEINDAKLCIDNYRKAVPLLIEAHKSIELVCNTPEHNTDDEHLQKLAISQLESNSMIADTCLAQAWNYLSMADPTQEDNILELPPLPDDIKTWARAVGPVVSELLQATNPCISKKEDIIANNEAEVVIIQEKLFQERRLVLIEAINGTKPNAPPYNDVDPIKRANTSLQKSTTTRELSKSNHNLPPLPPRTQSVSLQGSRQLLNQEPQKPKSKLPLDMTGVSFPSNSEPQISTSDGFDDSFKVESDQKSVESSFCLNDSLSNAWDDIPKLKGPKYELGDLNTRIEQSIPLKKEPLNDEWQSNIPFEQEADQELRIGHDKPVHDSWSKIIDDTPTVVSYEPPQELNSSIEKDITISEKMEEMYLENNQKRPQIPTSSSMMGLDDNPWN